MSDVDLRIAVDAHEFLAKSLADSAAMYRVLAGRQRPRMRGGEDLEAAAAACDMAAKGHVFRARELRYDAAGGHVPPGGWPSG